MLHFWGGGRFDISQTIFKTNTNLTAQLQTKEDTENLNTYIVFNGVVTKDYFLPNRIYQVCPNISESTLFKEAKIHSLYLPTINRGTSWLFKYWYILGSFLIMETLCCIQSKQLCFPTRSEILDICHLLLLLQCCCCGCWLWWWCVCVCRCNLRQEEYICH